MSVHFSSLRLDWKTPKAVYQILDAEFGFDHDPCPPKPKVDGLTSQWGKVNFVNPPYGSELPKWIKKGFEEWQRGGGSSLLSSKSNGYEMVARVLHESDGNQIHQGQTEIRRSEKLSTISKRNNHI